MTTRSTSEDATPRLVPRRLVRQRIGGASVVLIIAASIAIIAAMLPVLYLFVRGIGQGDATIEFLARPNSMFTLWRTINLIFIVTLTSLVVAVPAAWLTMNSDLPFKRFIAVALALPLVVPSFVMATTLIEAFGPKGALQRILQPVGVDQLPSIYGLPGSTLVLVLMTYPYVYLTVRAAIAGLNPELIDACRSMGYTTAQAFRRVTLPLLIPAIGSGSILAALYTLSDYGGVALMRHNTLTVSIMTNYQTSIDRSSGAALSMMLVVFAAGLLLGESLIKRRRRFDDASANAARSQRIISLGRYKAFALLFTLLPVVVGVIVPCLTMLRWLTRGIESGQGFTSVAMPLWNSMQASALAAVTTVIVALPIAFVTVRYRNAISEFFSQATYIGFGLPGVVVALSIVFFAVNFALFAYQTLALLIFAYAVSFLPAALGSLRAGLMQLNVRLEEAAQSLGKTQFQTVTQVTLPMLMPSIFASAAMVFLLTMKELPATLILGPTGFDTLATSIWAASSEAFFTETAVASLILVVAAGVPTAWLVLREHRNAQ